MTKKRFILFFIFLLGTPFLIAVVLYLIAMDTGLKGRRGGPQDAFRHTYSSALTARYVSPLAVEFFTYIWEREPEAPFDKMDIHNNKIGTKIGLSEGNIYETVSRKISEGQVNTEDPNTVTWLEEKKWDDGF